jgi:DTW domain-containing protein YfiP
LCAEVPRLVTRTQIVILRHHSERRRTSNSGRLAHLALAGSELRDVFAPDPSLTDGGRPAPPGAGAWLVFPEGEPRTMPPSPPPTALVFLDASWHQARRMRQRLAGLRGVPVLSLATVGGRRRMRRAPRPEHVSTIEAIAAALRLVEGGPAPDALEALFEVAVARMVRAGRTPA